MFAIRKPLQLAAVCIGGDTRLFSILAGRNSPFQLDELVEETKADAVLLSE